MKAFKYRIYPTKSQQEVLESEFGAVRWAYNYYLSANRDLRAIKERRMSFVEMTTDLARLKMTDEYRWLTGAYSQSLNQAIKNLMDGFTRHKNGQSRAPVFKSKRDLNQACYYPQGVKFKGRKIHIPKLGRVKIMLDRYCLGKIKTVTLKKTPTNKYFVSILVDDGAEQPKLNKTIPKNKVIGVDVGIKDFAVDSNGHRTANPRHFMKYHARLRTAQKSLSRKQIGSHRRTKQRLRVARIHEKVANCRHDFLHKTSTKMVDENQAVILEKLNVKGMTKNRKLAKHVHDLGLGEFSRLVAYKCAWRGKHFVEIDQWCPSSKTCFECCSVNKDLTLSDRTWECCSCGTILNRDLNAAKNIRREGINLIGQLGVSVLEFSENVEGMSDYYLDLALTNSSLKEALKLSSVV